ncbi:MAG: hypothetical protein AB7H96_13085 [Vicinamibacterales bacterium]
MLPTRTALLIAVAMGVALEVGTLGSRVGLPVAVVLSVVIGAATGGRGWLTPAAIGPAQFAAALYRGGSLASSWTGPFLAYLALGVPMLLAAYVGRRLRQRARR